MLKFKLSHAGKGTLGVLSKMDHTPYLLFFSIFPSSCNSSGVSALLLNIKTLHTFKYLTPWLLEGRGIYGLEKRVGEAWFNARLQMPRLRAHGLIRILSSTASNSTTEFITFTTKLTLSTFHQNIRERINPAQFPIQSQTRNVSSFKAIDILTHAKII